jgi:hypothetical protein
VSGPAGAGRAGAALETGAPGTGGGETQVAEGQRSGETAVSVAHLLPVGGEDRAAYRGPARLVRAAGDEIFDTMENGLPSAAWPR